jgi:hypothetical protein
MSDGVPLAWGEPSSSPARSQAWADRRFECRLAELAERGAQFERPAALENTRHMIKYSRRWLCRGEVWFDEAPASGGVDVLYFRQRTTPVPGAQCSVFHTLLIDLSVDSEEIWRRFSKTAQYKIRRAGERDSVAYESWNGSEAIGTLTRFCASYDRFAMKKGLDCADREYLRVLANVGALDISRVTDKDGKELVWHVHYRDRARAVLLHSFSSFREYEDSGLRNLIGRANRLHHWRDMLRYKEEGIRTYDFGGWYEGSSDREKLQINSFKEEFGGTVVKNHNCVELLTAKARFLIAAGGWLRRARGLVARGSRVVSVKAPVPD